MNKKFQPRHQLKESAHHLEAQPARDDKALILPVSLIRIGPNVRTELTNIEELTESIKTHGILQSLVVAKTPNGLELVAGRRRLEAARAAGLKEVPVRIIGADENQVKTIRLIENLQREELSPVEEIAAVADLAAVFDGNQDQLARALGKNKTYISRCLKTSKVMSTFGPSVATYASTPQIQILFHNSNLAIPGLGKVQIQILNIAILAKLRNLTTGFIRMDPQPRCGISFNIK